MKLASGCEESHKVVSLHARAHTHTLAEAGSSSIERERRRTKESRD